MTTTTTRTNIDIRVNTGAVRDADRAIRAAFDPRAVRGLQTALAQIPAAVQDLTAAMQALQGSIQGMTTSSHAGLGTMTTDLAAARAEAARLSAELQRLSNMRNTGGGYGGGGGGGGGGYGGGYAGSRGGPAQIPMPSLGALGRMFEAIPFVGNLISGGLQASAGYYGSAMSDARSKRDTYGMLQGFSPIGVGLAHGMTPAEARADAAQYIGASGGPAGYGLARGLSATRGVDYGTSGALVSGFSYLNEGQRSTGVPEMASAVGQAIGRGLRGTNLTSYLSKITGFLQQQVNMGKEGVNMNVLYGAASALQARGLNTAAAQNVSMGFAQAGQRIGMAGAGSQEELLLAQSMGFTGGAEQYMATMLRMQDPAESMRALPSVLQRVQQPGMTDVAKTFFTQRLMKAFGVEVQADAAKRMVGLSSIEGQVYGPAGGGVAPGSGFLRGEAQLEIRRAQVGYQAAPMIRNMESTVINLAGTVQNLLGPAITSLTTLFNDLASALNSISTGGFSGILAQLRSALLPNLGFGQPTPATPTTGSGAGAPPVQASAGGP